ncbi:MAG: STAS domain-containing protein [Actinobacteria bacterium]|nr:STAS domain-containing protein [Actinomycetota bacterium]
MNDTFLVSVQHLDGAGARIMCVGELDVATTDSLGRAIEQAIATAPAFLMIDCTGLTFISIDGLRLLLDTAERCQAAGMAITVDLDSNGRRLLEALEYPQTLVSAGFQS